MNLVVAKESDLREVRRVGSVHQAESKDYYGSKGKKMGVMAKETFLRPFEVYPSSEATMSIQG